MMVSLYVHITTDDLKLYILIEGSYRNFRPVAILQENYSYGESGKPIELVAQSTQIAWLV